MSLTPTQLANRSMQEKRVDNFYVSYLKISDNVSNLLGRQTKSITRPTVQWETSNTYHRGQKYVDKGQPQFNPVTATLRDDESGITSLILYAHAFRQENVLSDLYGRSDVLDRDYRFDVKVETFDSRDRMTESFILIDCFISSIEHTTPIVEGDESNEIIIELSYDNINFPIIDSYYDIKKELNF